MTEQDKPESDEVPMRSRVIIAGMYLFVLAIAVAVLTGGRGADRGAVVDTPAAAWITE